MTMSPSIPSAEAHLEFQHSQPSRQLDAIAAGFDQVVWLDSVERRFIEEAGLMNIFAMFGRRVLTPPLNGNILPGVTRDSVYELL